ncbi:DUF7925 domain-containing protein [Mastigocoleus testarum]|uniref:DUF7925 domain-containing protein n=1 Tax=Mastigocoleus testarum BC008 TaxID=371196 RepID=A0A0V8A167_9CYAN|nr:hypothetical protein [Mastigocoleus testarum]KST70383.1 hypothetical protein BC008_45120 [Mastigocoleus testarum BC008]
MSQKKNFVNKKAKIYRSLIAATLVVNGIFQFVAPVLSEGTRAGTSISNTATATYEDPNNPGTTINTTSNTVVVTVAEVAGITVTGAGTTLQTDVDGDSAADAGDIVYFNYTVTNVGNDPTQFRIPNLASTTGPATVSGNLEYSTDGGTTWTEITTTEATVPSIPVNGTVQVRVPVTVAAGAQANDIITVKLGDTPGDDQNQLRSPDGGDVYTVDNPDGTTDEVAGVPVNGVREASATQQVTVDASLKTYALAKVLKERSDYNNSGTLTDITDDTLTYDLSLEVEQNDPTNNGITPAPLVGTTINGLTGPRILVSDAIPVGTDLASVPAAPPGWEVVYTTDPITTDANAATWTTSAPADLTTVTRVGFVNDPNIVTSVNPGQTVPGFQITLQVESTATAPLTVNNIAQLFGSTPDNDADPTNNPPVFDESGDQNPSNFNDDGTPLAGTDTDGDGIPDILLNTLIDDGFIIDATDAIAIGVDTGNNNSATGDGGEVNQFVIDPSANALLNGPEGTPNAIGPTDNNDDFTNKSSLVPPGTIPDQGNTIDPAAVPFTNTIQNGGATPASISLLPTPPDNPADLPDGTTVTISYQDQSKTYTWNAIIGQFDNLVDFITVPDVASGAEVNYGVEVNLPNNTPLSTDLNDPADPNSGTIGGFPVPITAFVDDLIPGFQGTETNNRTIDRVYTGFLRLLKESRVLQGDGNAPIAGQDQFSTDPKQPSSGNIIEYRITYNNISDPEAGTGNITLNADKVVIEEDGTTGGNNWALDNDGDNIIDTSNIVGTAQDSGNANILFYSGNPSTTTAQDQTGTTVDTDVTKYVDEVTGAILPGQSENFTFQRKVN